MADDAFAEGDEFEEEEEKIDPVTLAPDLFAACKLGDADAARNLLEQKVPPSHAEGETGWTCLHWAVRASGADDASFEGVWSAPERSLSSSIDRHRRRPASTRCVRRATASWTWSRGSWARGRTSTTSTRSGSVRRRFEEDLVTAHGDSFSGLKGTHPPRFSGPRLVNPGVCLFVCLFVLVARLALDLVEPRSRGRAGSMNMLVDAEEDVAFLEQRTDKGVAVALTLLTRNTPLHWAAFHGHLRVVWVLLESGYDADDADEIEGSGAATRTNSFSNRVVDVAARQDVADLIADFAEKNDDDDADGDFDDFSASGGSFPAEKKLARQQAPRESSSSLSPSSFAKQTKKRPVRPMRPEERTELKESNIETYHAVAKELDLATAAVSGGVLTAEAPKHALYDAAARLRKALGKARLEAVAEAVLAKGDLASRRLETHIALLEQLDAVKMAAPIITQDAYTTLVNRLSRLKREAEALLLLEAEAEADPVVDKDDKAASSSSSSEKQKKKEEGGGGASSSSSSSSSSKNNAAPSEADAPKVAATSLFSGGGGGGGAKKKKVSSNLEVLLKAAEAVVARSHAEYWLKQTSAPLDAKACADMGCVRPMIRLQAAIVEADRHRADADLCAHAKAVLHRFTAELEVSNALVDVPAVNVPIADAPADYWGPEDLGAIVENEHYPLPPEDGEYKWQPSAALSKLRAAANRLEKALVDAQAARGYPPLVEAATLENTTVSANLKQLERKDEEDREIAVAAAEKAAKKLKKKNKKKKAAEKAAAAASS